MVGGEIKVVMTMDNDDFSIKTVKAGRVINELKRNIEQTAASTKRLENHFTSFGQKFRDLTFTISVARFALQDINDIVLALPRAIVGASGEIERMGKLLEGLSTKADETARKLEAASNLKFVFGLAKNSPFEVTALTDAMVKFKTAGLDPTNGSLQALVDSVARFGGTSEHLKRASIAIQQMSGKGVISMEELRQQLGEAVPNAMQLMAEGMGMSMADMVKRISKGEVEAKSALDKMLLMMQTRNSGAAAKMMDTWTGQLARLKTELTLFFNEAGGGAEGDGLFATVKKELADLNKYLSSSEVKKFAQDVGRSLAEIVSGLVQVIKFFHQFGSEIWTAAQALAALWATQRVLQFGRAVASTFADVRQSILNYVNTAVAGERARLTEQAKANQQRLVNEAATARQELDIQRKKYAENLVLANTYYANYQRLDERAHTLKTARARQRNAEMASHQFALAMAQDRANAKMAASIKSLEATHNGAMASMRANANAFKAQMASMSTSAIVAARGMTVLRGALAAVGGPIGLITTLLTFGSMAWIAWGNDAKEAVDRANSAIKSGSATVEDMMAKQEEARKNSARQLEIENKLAQYAKLKKDGVDVEADPMGKKAVDKLREELRQLKEDAPKIYRDIGRAKIQAEQNFQDDIGRRTSEHLNEQFNKLELALNSELAAKIELKDKKKLTDEEYNKWSIESTRKLYADQRAIVQDEIAKVRAKQAKAPGGSQLAKELTAEINFLNKKLKEVDDLVARSRELGQNVFHSSKGADKDKSGIAGAGNKGQTPLEQFIEKVNEDIARLREAGDDVKSELQLFNQKIANGDFMYEKKGKDGKSLGMFGPTEEELAKVRAMLVQREQLALKNKEIDKVLSESASARDRLADMLRNADLKIEDAEANLSAGTNSAVSNKMSALRRQIEDIRTALEEAMWIDGPEGDRAFEALINLNKNADKILGAQTFEENKNFILKLRQEADSALADVSYNALDRENDAFNRKVQLLYQELQANLETTKDAEALWSAYYDTIGALAQSHMRKIKTPLQQLADEWKDTTAQMRQASVGWANSALDALMNFTKTGKFEFSSFVESILDDLLRIQMQRAMAETVLPFLDSATSAAGNWISGKMGGSGSGGGGGGFLDSIAGFFGFANGGIMTENGALQLRKYANGGIANTPQLALYGEGSMPEAYVPLPDGRTIPVTMQGGGGPGNVVVNVINQTSMAVNAKKSEPRFDGRQMVLDVVLTAASQPGPFREGLKGALS